MPVPTQDSFGRAYATALAEVDADGRLSMRLTGHKSLSTHSLYVMRSGTMRVPGGGAAEGARWGRNAAPRACISRERRFGGGRLRGATERRTYGCHRQAPG